MGNCVIQHQRGWTLDTVSNTPEGLATGKGRHQRQMIAEGIAAYGQRPLEVSQRSWADAEGIPRSSLQNWLRRKENLEGSPVFVEFMESPDGLAFLHKVMVALHLVFNKNGGGSPANIVDFLEKTGLNAFVASSLTYQQELSGEIDKLLVAYGEEEKKRLSKVMPEKDVYLGEDETFHPEICMVVMDLVSGFILGEGYVEKRDGETWGNFVSEALEGLPVKPRQVTGDEGKAIIYHVEKVLDIHRNSDLFHVNQELVRGATGPLATMERRAQNQYDKVMARTPSPETAENGGSTGAGRLRSEPRPKLRAEREQAGKDLVLVQANRKQALEANSRIGEVYHPFDLSSGGKQDAPAVKSLLKECFEEIEQAAVGLSEKCHQHIAKAKRVLSSLVGTIAFFFSTVERVLKDNPLPPHLHTPFLDLLLPSKYLALAAGRQRNVKKKHAISELAKTLLRQFHERAGPFPRGDPTLGRLEKLAQDLAYVFQRSSSAVEGRNAQLSLRHQGLHRFSKIKLGALTVMHNFYATRPDGTTAAKRFFENEPDDLFEWLQDRIEVPARPRKRQRKVA